MKKITENKCIAIKETEPDAFAKKYQEALSGVDNPEVQTQYSDGFFVAIITWQEARHEVDTVADEFHMEGIRYICDQCPYLEHDGDGRKHRFPCKYSETGTAHVKHECCEVFYRQLKQGMITPRY